MFFTNIGEKIDDWFEEHPQISACYTTYVREKAVPQGYPFSLITTLACARFFQCSTIPVATLFATVNYTVLTASLEMVGKNPYKNLIMGSTLIIASGIVSGAALSVLLGERPSNKACAILTLAGLVGQFFRPYFREND